jgi:type IV pilus assembly protein PilB
MSDARPPSFPPDSFVVFENGDAPGDDRAPAAPSANGAAASTTGAAPTGDDLRDGPRDRVVDRLLRREGVTPQQVAEAQAEWRRQGENDTLWRMLARHPQVDRDQVFAEAAHTYAFRVEPVDPDALDTDFVREVIDRFDRTDQDKLLAMRLLPLRRERDEHRGVTKLVCATYDPTRPELYQVAHELGLSPLELCYAPESVIAPLLDELYPRRNEYLERLEADDQSRSFDIGTSYEGREQSLVNEEELEAEINRSALINLFEAALVESVRMGASDIHIFPTAAGETEFHMRVDGVLMPWHTQDKVHPEAMLAVVKDRCMNVDRFDREIAQDGYVQRTVDGKLIRYRVSVLPLASTSREVKAESIVIRVLDDRRVFTDLRQINLQPEALRRFEKAIAQPHGMVIMTGPTGSGKSTTLAAALHSVISPERNVLTVEDPVEYIISGARQIKLGPRLPLQGALRSILRHDPDVVMVGEMRDRDTAELAIKLANTGHLTFSTLHTNDAPSAVSRLFKMGIEPFLIAYAINLVVAQRLVRTVCPTCRRRDPDPDPVLLGGLGFSEAEIADTAFYQAGTHPTCRTCGGSGYKGRQAIAEALYFSRAIRHLIVESDVRVDEDAIRDTAIAEGMLSLVASAREVVKRGDTTIDELIRVVSTE